MFRFSPAESEDVERRIAIAFDQPAACPRILAPTKGLQSPLPSHFAHDHSRSQIGCGANALHTVKKAFADWKMFDLGWVRVANPDTRIEPGSIVAVEARTLGMWTLNLSRIVEFIDLPETFGFIYATNQFHVELGEERFLIELDSDTNEVWFDIEAVSRPAHFAARIGLPVSRAYQHKFARDSHRRLRELIP